MTDFGLIVGCVSSKKHSYPLHIGALDSFQVFLVKTNKDQLSGIDHPMEGAFKSKKCHETVQCIPFSTQLTYINKNWIAVLAS